jgi:hypothetical protein
MGKQEGIKNMERGCKNEKWMTKFHGYISSFTWWTCIMSPC